MANPHKLDLIPEKYYLEWEHDILEGFANLEYLTRNIIETGTTGVIEELVRSYGQWASLLSRYRGYLDKRENYCKVLDNGFHLYEPIELMRFVKIEEPPYPKLWDGFNSLRLHQQELWKNSQPGNTYSVHGSSATLDELEEYVTKIVAHEEVLGLPQENRLSKNNCVVMVRELSGHNDSRSKVLRASNFSNSRKNEEMEEFQNGAKYIWDIFFLAKTFQF